MAFTMTSGNVRKIHRILADLLEHGEADGCMVCDQAGHVLDQVGVATHDPHLLSALGAGVFSATRELARILGEDEFSIVLHQGALRSIILCAVNEDALLGVIFSSVSSVGLVKLYAPLAADSIRNVLEDVTRTGQEVEAEMQSFIVSDDGDLFALSEEGEE
ncbi:MAG: roadblock/LC7 domain-containing protein [Verrucomicrobiota bacterium]